MAMNDEYNPEIVSVIDEDGKEHMFEELDRIETEDGRYVALLPLYDDTDKLTEDEAGELIILRVTEEKGESILEPIEDEDEFNEIGKLFEERLADMFEFDDEDTDEN